MMKVLWESMAWRGSEKRKEEDVAGRKREGN